MTLIISILLALSNAQANPSCAVTPKKISGLAAICDQLEPKCITTTDDELKASKTPEQAIEKLLANNKISEEEIFTRLIFAEGLASKCIPGENDDYIFSGIANVIENRVRAKNNKLFGTGVGVVTKYQQFRSSTGGCDVAHRTEFLCPSKSGPKWEEAWAKAAEARKASKENESKLPGIYNYYFPKHFEKSVGCKKWGLPENKPGWSKSNFAKLNVPNSNGNACITFHKL